jgi:uncharacterized repeat protein (TIGR01451 family)
MSTCQWIADPVRLVGVLPPRRLHRALAFSMAGARLLCLTVVGIVATETGASAQLAADLSITKTDGVATAVPGGSVTYTITASNAGPDAVVGATVADTFAASLTVTWTCVGAGGGTCTAAGAGNISDTVNLPVGGSVTYTATGTISSSATGSLSNTATVSSPVTDPDPANNSATDTDTLTPQAELQITKTDGVTTATPGGSVTYTITASNAGPSNVAGATVADTFPASLTATWTCVGAGGGTCTAAGSGNFSDTVNLPAGGSVTYTASATINSAATGTLTNTATIASAAGVTDPNPGNNSATDTDTLTASADLSITSVDTPDPVVAGQNVTYTVTTTNNGPSQASMVTVTDAVPTNTTFVSASVSTGSGWTTSTPAVGASGNIVFSKASVAHAETAVFEIVVRVGTATAGGTVVTNTAIVGSSTTDPTPGNNSGVATTTVDGPPTITAIADQTIAEGTATTALPFTVADVETPAASLTLAGTSSNQALVPDTNVVFGGTGTSRTVTVTPLPDQAGQTTITVTVSDGATSAATSFVLTVTATERPTYFLAEGATGAFFDEDLLIANPNATDAPVTVTFLVEDGATVTERRTIPARSGTRLAVDTLPGLEAASASVQVSSDGGLPLAVERTQFWDATAYGGHTERALPGPATRWFFAEGAQGYFDTFVLIANPQAAPVEVTLTFLREGAASVTTTRQIAPFARQTIPAASIPELANRSFAILVEAPQPVVAERAMYFGSTATRLWTGGSAATGVTAPSSTWFFAEGATGPLFDTFLLLMNPEAVDAQVTLRYLLDTGETVEVAKVIPARGRLTVNIETEGDARLHAASMATVVTSDRPIVAERSVYWPTAEGAQPWGESHTSQGAPAAAPRWALAEGRTGGALNFHTYVLIANPGSQAAEANVQFLADGGAPVMRTYVVPAMSRLTVDVTAEASELQDRSFITLIATTGDVPIVVERSMYWHGAGLTWSGGSNAGATRLPE